MAAIQSNSGDEIQEITANQSEHGDNIVDLTSDAEDHEDHEPQAMEIEADIEQQTENHSQNEGTQPVNDENTASDDTEMQSSVQNVTAVVGRTVQVLGGVSVNSPDEFQNKASKPAKIKPSKAAKSPLKSPEKDDDVSLACLYVVAIQLLELEMALFARLRSNGNCAVWSTIQGVIGRVISNRPNG